MNCEVIDVKIAQVTTGSWGQSRRREAGLVEDSGDGLPELILGWAAIKDFADAQVLERLLIYEKRIESSLYKAMSELQKIQRIREKEQAEEEQAVRQDEGFEVAIHRARDARDTETGQVEKQSQLTERAEKMKKQSQCTHLTDE